MNQASQRIDHGTKKVLGVPIRAINYAAAVDEIVGAAKDRRPLTVAALAVHGVMTGALDPEHRYRLNKLDFLVPDGQPVRWALRWLYNVKLPDRVYGPNLMLEVCRAAEQHNLPIYLHGSTDETLDVLAANLRRKLPKLTIAGKQTSKFRQLSAEEKSRVVQQIKNSGARIIFSGLGCPRQEVWAYEYRDVLSSPILAVGAAFNFHAGNLEQAPRFLQDRGLEWAYRLYREPRRLWQRYLILNPLYLILLLAQWMKIRSFERTKRPKTELRYG